MHKINNYMLLLFTTLTLVSCEKWLDLKQENDVIKEDFWKTEQQIRSAVLGCYASMLEEGFINRVFLWGEIRADMLNNGDGIGSDFLRIMEADISPDNGVTKWQHFYKSINLCNTVLDYAKNALETDITFTEKELKAYEAEALGLRSLLYFYLLRTFGEVPLMLESVTSDQDEFFIEKSSQQVIIDQIISDLQIARQHAVTSFSDEEEDKGRLNKYGISAILADVYLWNEDYQSCSNECDTIMDSQKYTLVAGINWFEEIFVRGNSSESIFELQFSAEKNNTFYDFFYPKSDQVFNANFLVNLLYTETDVRGEGATYWSKDTDFSTIFKYIGLSSTENDAVFRSDGSSTANWIFYRLADIMLMKAEALNQLEQGSEAMKLVDSVQARAGELVSTVDEDNIDMVTDEILLVRQKELAYEGKRWFDVLRNARRNDYARKDILNTMIENSAPSDEVDLIISKYSDSRSHYLPIYYEEIEINDLLVQNLYYDF